MKAKIKIEKRSWSGWVPVPPDVTEAELASHVAEAEFSLEEGGIVKMEKLEQQPRSDSEFLRQNNLKLLEVKKDFIKIQTSGVVPKREGKGIDLTANTRDLISTIPAGSSLKFSTPSMDAGTTYVVSFLGTGDS